MTPGVADISWYPCWRVIPSRFVPIQLFERTTDPQDLEAVLELETLTNSRVHGEVGQFDLVPPQDRISGSGSSVIMAAFTHPNPSGSQFSDGHFGVLYGAKKLETAIAETCYHRERFMDNTRQPATELDMRVYCIDLSGKLHDLREKQDELPLIFDQVNNTEAQQLGNTLRNSRSNGIVYRSVRHSCGECAAVFRPSLLSNARQERHLCYVWDGNKIAKVYEKRELQN